MAFLFVYSPGKSFDYDLTRILDSIVLFRFVLSEALVRLVFHRSADAAIQVLSLTLYLVVQYSHSRWLWYQALFEIQSSLVGCSILYDAPMKTMIQDIKLSIQFNYGFNLNRTQNSPEFEKFYRCCWHYPEIFALNSVKSFRIKSSNV